MQYKVFFSSGSLRIIYIVLFMQLKKFYKNYFNETFFQIKMYLI